MNVVAAMIVRNELDRYLELAVEHALTYCDRVAIFDDGSTDGMLYRATRAASVLSSSAVFIESGEIGDAGRLHFEHEGRARQRLFELALEQHPTHVLVIDADEFVTDGRALRDGLAVNETTVYRVCMEEAWNASPAGVEIRCDGGWRPHPIPGAFRPPREVYGEWRMLDRALACGREPIAVRRMQTSGDVADLDVSIWHFGWACRADRAARIERYTVVDGGKFHRNDHILSIGLPDDRCDLEFVEWPEGLELVRERLLERIGRS